MVYPNDEQHCLRKAAKAAKEQQQRAENRHRDLDRMFEKEKQECSLLLTLAWVLMCVALLVLLHRQKNINMVV